MFAIGELATLKLPFLSRDRLADDLRRNRQGADDFSVQNTNAACGDCTEGEFFMSGDSEFPNHENIETRAKPVRNLEGYRNSASRQTED